MPEDTKRLSELERATSVAPSTLVFVSIEDATSESGFSTRAMTIELLAEELLKRMQFSDLETVSKTIIEAINDAAESGGGGGGSTVTISDNPAGGVDLTVDGTTKTLANESDLTTLKADLTSLNTNKLDINPINWEGWTDEERLLIQSKTELRLICDLVVNTDDVADFWVNNDVNGNTFILNKFFALIESSDKSASFGSSIYLGVNNNAYSFYVSDNNTVAVATVEYDLTKSTIATVLTRGSTNRSECNVRLMDGSNYAGNRPIQNFRLHSDSAAGSRIKQGARLRIWGC